MSATEEQVECSHEAWEEYGGGSRKCADCGAFLPHASNDTPTPERVTLSAEEREQLRGLGQGQVPATVERIIAAREQALREEIAGEIEADLVAMETGTSEGFGWHRANRRAARIARGGAR